MDAYLGLGSNLGDRRQHLRQAIRLLNEAGVRVERVSSLYETEPMHFTEQPRFLNAVAQVRTALGPHDLLQAVKRIETDIGRQMRFRYGPREIDIDILTYGDERFETAELTIPHPRMRERPFVQAPLAELSGAPAAPEGAVRVEGPEWADG